MVEKAPFFIAGISFAICVLFLVAIYVTGDEKQAQYLDFRNSFYIAGQLVRQGRIGDLYPRASDNTFGQTEFNRIAHGQLRSIPGSIEWIFFYPPLVALVFAALSILPPKESCLLWQAICLCALALSTHLFTRLPGVKTRMDRIFFSSFLALPLVYLLIFGQVGIVFGILPLVCGYLFWQTGRFRQAGFIWALLSVKIPYFLPVACMVAVEFFSSLYRPQKGSLAQASDRDELLKLTQGLFAGLLAFQLSPLIITGPQSLIGWFESLRLANTTLSDPGYAWASQVIISAPLTLTTVLCPPEKKTLAVGLSYLVALVFLLGSILVLSVAKARFRGTPKDGHSAIFILVFLSLPFISVYLRAYDCAILLVPTWIAAFQNFDSAGLRQTLLRSVIMAWVSLNSYMLVLFLPGLPSREPFLLACIAVLLGAWCWAVTVVVRGDADRIVT